MAKEMKKKKDLTRKITVFTEINNSLYSLATYLSGFTSALRETAIKQEIR